MWMTAKSTSLCRLACHPHTFAAVIDAERRHGTVRRYRARTTTALRLYREVLQTAQIGW